MKRSNIGRAGIVLVTVLAWLPTAGLGQAHEIHHGQLRLADGAVVDVEYVLVDGQAIFDGDIVLHLEDDGELRIARHQDELSRIEDLYKSAVRASAAYRWPGGRVYYKIDPALSHPGRVESAILHWESETSLQFIERTFQGNYVTFKPSSVCNSPVGMQGGQQFVNLSSGCGIPQVIHEIGHVVGMFHEHNRSDRDQYVQIHWQNIQPGLAFAFTRYVDNGYSGIDQGPYDFRSVMHYPSYAFSANGQATITRTDGSSIPFNSVLSAGDVGGADFMYGAEPFCGDGSCNGGETCTTCPKDCGACGCNFNFVCEEATENSTTCPEDCCGGPIPCEGP